MAVEPFFFSVEVKMIIAAFCRTERTPRLDFFAVESAGIKFNTAPFRDINDIEFFILVHKVSSFQLAFGSSSRTWLLPITVKGCLGITLDKSTCPVGIRASDTMLSESSTNTG